MGPGFIYMHGGELADQAGIAAGEVDDPVILGAAGEPAGVLLRIVADQDALQAADHAPADFVALLVEQVLQARQAFAVGFGRYLVVQGCRRSAGARAVDEGIGEIEADLGDQLQGLLEILFGLAGKPDYEVRGDADVWADGPELADLRLVFEGGVVALHRRENAVGAGLDRQVQVLDQFRHLGMHLDQAVGELQGVRGGVADAVDAVDSRNHPDQFGQVGAVAVVGEAAITVDVLPEQGDLAYAVFGQMEDFAEYVVEGPADFLTASVGHHAEGAVLAAAFHDRDEGARAIDTRFRQVVEFLDLREAHVHLGLLGGTRGVDHLRQAVQGLRAEDHIDVGRAVADRRAFLAGHAAAHGHHPVPPCPPEL